MNLFTFSLPSFLRRDRAPDSDRQRTHTLAGISDSNPVYRAVVEQAQDQFERECVALLSNTLTPAQAEFQRGRAANAYAFLQELEAARQEAKTELQLEQKQAEARAKQTR